jgi:xylan 1,4-beta-xylosidase
MGSPLAPTRKQYDELLAASELAPLQNASAHTAIHDSTATLKFPLPRQAVSLLVIEWQ